MTRPSSDQSERLLIDRAAAAELPADDVIREWARDKRGFISSVMAGFNKERTAAVEALREVGLRPVIFEEFGGRDADPEQAYLTEVETSDIYIGILGQHRQTAKDINDLFLTMSGYSMWFRKSVLSNS